MDPWNLPDCPDCGGHILVERDVRENSDWYCNNCGTSFDADPVERSVEDVTQEVR